MNLKNLHVKIDVPCEDFVHSHQMSQMPGLLRNFRIVTVWCGPDSAIRQNTCNTTKLKFWACHAKWRWKCTIHVWQRCYKGLRMSHRTTLDTLFSTLECHEIPPAFHTPIARGRLTVAQTRPNPQTPKVKREPVVHIWADPCMQNEFNWIAQSPKTSATRPGILKFYRRNKTNENFDVLSISFHCFASDLRWR